MNPRKGDSLPKPVCAKAISVAPAKPPPDGMPRWHPSCEIVDPTTPVLYAEDTEGDAFFMQRAFTMANIPNPLKIVGDGQEAIDYLSGLGAFSDRKAHPMPCLLLLDLKLPIKSGFEVLQWVREHPALNRLVVVIVSSSGQEVDHERAQKLGVNDYIVKTNSPKKLIEIVKALRLGWF